MVWPTDLFCPVCFAGLCVDAMDHCPIRLYVKRTVLEHDVLYPCPAAIHLDLREPGPRQAVTVGGGFRNDFHRHGSRRPVAWYKNRCQRC